MAKVGDFGLAKDISEAGIYTITSSVSVLCNQYRRLEERKRTNANVLTLMFFHNISEHVKSIPSSRRSLLINFPPRLPQGSRHLKNKPKTLKAKYCLLWQHTTQGLKNLKQILMQEWNLIQNQPLLKTIYKTPPIISYKRGKSLKDILVRAKL